MQLPKKKITLNLRSCHLPTSHPLASRLPTCHPPTRHLPISQYGGQVQGEVLHDPVFEVKRRVENVKYWYKFELSKDIIAVN